MVKGVMTQEFPAEMIFELVDQTRVWTGQKISTILFGLVAGISGRVWKRPSIEPTLHF
jgi:hypothetical protein